MSTLHEAAEAIRTVIIDQDLEASLIAEVIDDQAAKTINGWRALVMELGALLHRTHYLYRHCSFNECTHKQCVEIKERFLQLVKGQP